MRIEICPNAGSDSERVPYWVRIEIVEAAVDFADTCDVPVYIRRLNGRLLYDVEVCGFRVETDQVDLLKEMVARTLAGLINMSRLPTYVFVARRSREIYPVYTVGSDVLATTPGGPVFRDIELARVRRHLSDYLHQIGILGSPGKSDKLHVRGVNTSSLALMRPVFYLKKRRSGESDFWAPVFLTRDGQRIYAWAATHRQERPIAAGNEVLALHASVARALMTDARLHNPADLRPDRMLPEVWDRFLTTLTPDSEMLAVLGRQLPVFRCGDLIVALEYRADENRYGVFLGDDIGGVRERAVQDFERRDKLLSGRSGGF